MPRRVGDLAHLTRRFFASFGAVADPADDAWARSQLSADEAALWMRHAPVDRAHTVRVARSVLEQVDRATEPTPSWLVPAALLHDIGKVDAPLGPIGRAMATALELARVRRAPGVFGRYLTYPQRGADVLAAASSAPEVVAWALEHHLDAHRWTVPAAWAEMLAAADSGPGK